MLEGKGKGLAPANLIAGSPGVTDIGSYDASSPQDGHSSGRLPSASASSWVDHTGTSSKAINVCSP